MHAAVLRGLGAAPRCASGELSIDTEHVRPRDIEEAWRRPSGMEVGSDPLVAGHGS